MLIPWSAFWERNYFVDWSPALRALLVSNYTRGAVTGLGLLNVWAALAELSDTFGSRRSPDDVDRPPADITPQSDTSNRQW